MFENISGGSNENVDSYETDALMQKLDELNNDTEVVKRVEEALQKLELGYATYTDLLDAVDSLESFTEGEISEIEATFDALSLNKDLESALDAVEALAGAIEAAKEGV